ncbi:hypothetical protein ROHU_004392 [Labeo rohita]|uniref:NACHT domain-containing protein n=1 Tax=Labeo rohita TaxID=84645 RepID=A0A498NMZ6_LABRO|nr:hypothetical protein ROHU_004392 [Labeo rohita]
MLKLLSSVYNYSSFPYGWTNNTYQSDFLLDLYSHVKDYETETGRSFLPALQSVFQSPDVWIIDLSQRKTFILLEVLKLQTEKKSINLRGCSEEESEVMSFLQCLPYISQLSCYRFSQSVQNRFLLELFIKAAETKTQTGEQMLKLLSSVCNYSSFPYGWTGDTDQSDFLLDLYSHVKNYETQTGRSFLPALQSVFQSPDVWIIDLSQRKTFILLEVLKLQTKKKPVELRRCSEEESEMMSFLQCLPFISQLRFCFSDNEEMRMSALRFLLSVSAAAVRNYTVTGTIFSTLLSFVCSYETFPFDEECDEYIANKQSDFLLDLYSHVKNYETQTGRSFLPVLQSVFQSAPDVWIIDLSQRKSSILLEVLKLQTKKKPVELRECSEEESEMKTFLQCLSYISQLRFSEVSQSVVSRFLLSLFIKAAETETQTGEQMLKLLSSVCNYGSFPYGWTYNTYQSDFLLDLYSNVKNYETQTGRSFLPVLQLSGYMVVRIVQTLQSRRVRAPVTVNELTLDPNDKQRSERNLSRVMSSLAILLRLWSVQRLNLTEYKIQSVSISALLCHQGPVTLRPSKETLQKLVECVCEAQEEELTQCFLQKVGGDLTSCSLNWEELHYFLQHKIQLIAVDFRKTNIKCSISEILPFLNRIKFKRVDRLLLLKMLRCCSVSDVQQEAAAVLLSVLQHKLDFSCRSALDLTTNTDSEPLYLTTDDCRVMSRVIKRAHSDTKIQLILHDCEINTAGIYQLFPVLHSVQLCCDKSLLLQFLAHVRPEEAESLSRALGEELDLSQTQLDPQVCRGLVLILEYSEGLTELDLSQCHLTDDSLNLLLPNLHKAQNIDFSGNNITDNGAQKIYSIVTRNSNIKTVSDHEVDALKAERTDFDKARCILDWVINKGEMASYELLRILDVTKKRTLDPGLHYWISCFSFGVEETEASYSFGTEPCKIYQTKLKKKAESILKDQRECCCKYLEDNVQGNFSFIPLVLETDPVVKPSRCKITLKNKKYKKLRPKKLRAYIPNEEQALSPEDLLKCQDKNILIIGKPGIGKTTVVQEMLRLWAENDNRELDYMFYFDESVLANTYSAASLESLLFDVYLKPMEKDRKDVFQDIEENSENVVIVLDGVTDLKGNSILRKIMKHELLPDARIVITCRSESAPDVWSIDLSLRKSSVLLEVLKLQKEKKPVELRRCSEEESEMMSFLHCLPYISQLIIYDQSESVQYRFLLKLFIKAAEIETQTGEQMLKLLTSVCTYKSFPYQLANSIKQIDFLLDLCSHVKNYETQTGRSFLPALQSLFLLPDVWIIDLSQRKSSIFLEVLKLQTEKKPVELKRWAGKGSEIRSFLPCMPYISDLRFLDIDYEENRMSAVTFLRNLCVAGVKSDTDKRRFSTLLSSVCSYESFCCNDDCDRIDFLLDLCSHVKDYLSEREISILLEVLKLQTEKKPVELRECSEEESEMMDFLQCLPYISQLRFLDIDNEQSKMSTITFLLNLCVAAVQSDTDTGTKFLTLLSSVCSYESFHFDDNDDQMDFLLDLCSHLKNYENQTGRNFLPALQSVFQSPDVWIIDLSQRKTSVHLEVLKLQTEKKPVELRECLEEESEIMYFLQCLPYISQLK